MSQKNNKFSINDMDESQLIDFWNIISSHIDDIEMSHDVEDEVKKVRDEAKILLDKTVEKYYK